MIARNTDGIVFVVHNTIPPALRLFLATPAVGVYHNADLFLPSDAVTPTIIL